MHPSPLCNFSISHAISVVRIALVTCPGGMSAANLTAAGGPDQLERFEGMRVQAASLTVVAPTAGSVTESSATSASNGVLFAVLPGVALPMREAGIEVLDTPANPATACAAGAGCTIPIFDANPERIRIDSDAAGQPKIDVNTGATLTNLLGVLNYTARAFTILPTQAPTVGGTQLSPTTAPAPPENPSSVLCAMKPRMPPSKVRFGRISKDASPNIA